MSIPTIELKQKRIKSAHWHLGCIQEKKSSEDVMDEWFNK